ncbi:MAG: hypothetical protein U0935_24150 [Pirellulales bacterium]
MRVQCPQCRTIHDVADSLAGTRAQCRCGAQIAIPRPAPAVAAPAAPAAAPTALRCPRCLRVHAIAPAMYGTQAQCPCGHVLTIPRPAGPASPAAAFAPAGNAPAGYAGGPAPSPAGWSSPGSLLDELTAADLRPPEAPTAAVSSQQQRDTELLRKYVRDDSAFTSAGARPGIVSTLAVLKIVGIVFGVLALILLIVVATGLEVMLPEEMAPVRATLAVTIVVMCADLLVHIVAAVGMYQRHPWGWWAAMFSYLLEAWASVGNIIVGIAALGAADGGARAAARGLGGGVVYIGFALFVTISLLSQEVLAYFRVRGPAILYMLLIGFVAMICYVVAALCSHLAASSME